MQLTDSHCHLTFDVLADDLAAVLERSRAADVTRWITIGTSLSESSKALALAQAHEAMYATVGIHPHDAKDADEASLEQLKQWAAEPKVVAIGETGLDFHYSFSPHETQQAVFRQHLDLAVEVGLPVVIHTREAFSETLEILDDYQGRLKAVVLHCFTGDADQAHQGVERDFFFSFSGALTFKKSEAIREAAACVPLERLMVETDCPYLSPAPMRKQKINEPALVVHTARCLAGIKGVDLEELANITWKNTTDFFDLA